MRGILGNKRGGLNTEDDKVTVLYLYDWAEVGGGEIVGGNGERAGVELDVCGP